MPVSQEVTYNVKNIERTANFYAKLGFRLGVQDEDSLTVYVNWFWIRFQAIDGLSSERNDLDSNTLLNLKVVDVDEFYEGILEAGFTSSTKPHDQPWGHRELALQDPDGHTFVFFQKTK